MNGILKRLAAEAASSGKILDSNGNELQDGDSVVVIKDLPVKGAPKPVKGGNKSEKYPSKTR